ncbi:MAG: hypothetical protein Q4A71_06945 [Actinomycetaceae bacterium]|nr:hypothetical protein [Actinomycetaceae bacterium]
MFRSNHLDDALEGADVVVMAVVSGGVEGVTKLALPGIAKAKALWLTSKGFCKFPDGRIEQLPTAIRQIGRDEGYTVPPIVAIAGPVKANECAARKPTATIFGCKDGELALKYACAAYRKLCDRCHG